MTDRVCMRLSTDSGGSNTEDDAASMAIYWRISEGTLSSREDMLLEHRQPEGLVLYMQRTQSRLPYIDGLSLQSWFSQQSFAAFPYQNYLTANGTAYLKGQDRDPENALICEQQPKETRLGTVRLIYV